LYAANDTLHQICEEIDRHYDRLGSMKANFDESYQGAGFSRHESGVLLLKRSGKMRWEYNRPRPKLFITNGKTAYFYVPGEREARKTNVNNLDDLRSPLRYLLGKAKLEKEFKGLSLDSSQAPMNAGDRILRGVPVKMGDQISDVELEVNDRYQIVRIAITGQDGSRTEFRFGNLEENAKIDDRSFDFTLPAGVEVVEGTSFGP